MKGSATTPRRFSSSPTPKSSPSATCWPQHRKRAKDAVDAKYGNKDCREYVDFREVLARKDIDAVMIGTPDHWHVPISLLALEAGKDVFCEKPTLTIAEGRTLVDAVARHKAVYQVGLEDRSVMYYHKMAELARNGALGKLKAIHAKLPPARPCRSSSPCRRRPN